MAKRKVLIECLVDYHIEPDRVNGFAGGWIKQYLTVPVTVDIKIKNQKNVGGEIWDWAQSHWDEFLDAVGPKVTIEPGVIHSTVLRWCGVGGVLDAKTKKYLPIEEKTWSNHAHPRAKNKKTSVKAKPKPKKTKVKSSVPRGQNSSKTPNKPGGPPSLVPTDDFDVEAYRKEKIKKAMDDE